MSRELRQYVPNAPMLLCQQLINDAYEKILATRNWSGLRAAAQFRIPDPYTTGTIAATLGSATFTGTGTAWTSDMIGRQLKVNNQSPVLTITAVNTGAQTLTTSEVWGLASAPTAQYTIVLLYVTPPEDFSEFIAVTDPLRQWQLFWWASQTQINNYDPARTATGDPWLLADLTPDAAGLPRYELWPAPSTGRVYPYFYYRKGVPLVNPTDEPVKPLRGSEIVHQALADLCRWPGTASTPNPLFNQMPLMAAFLKEANDMLMDVERKDEELYMTWYFTALTATPFAPLMDSWTQSHAMYQY